MTKKHFLQYLSAAACLALLLTACASQPPSSGAAATSASSMDTSAAPTTATAASATQPAVPTGPFYGTVARSAGSIAFSNTPAFRYDSGAAAGAAVGVPGNAAQQAAANQFFSQMQTAYPAGLCAGCTACYGLLGLSFEVGADQTVRWPFPKMIKTVTLTADGQALSIADLFYNDVDILAYINERISYAGINEEQQKRAFTGYTALPSAFFLGEGRVDLKIDANDPFFTVSDIYISLSPQVSPYGEDYVDVTYQDTGIPFSFDMSNINNRSDPRTTLLVPSVRFDNGAVPDKDAAANAAIQAMIPALKKAGTSGFPRVNVYGGYLSVVYQERETNPGEGGGAYAAAVPGAALLWNIHAGKPADIAAFVAGHQWLYAPLTGDLNNYFLGENADQDARWNFYFPAIAGYTPPAGSVYSDLYWLDHYFLTVTQPDGQRFLMAQADIYVGQQ